MNILIPDYPARNVIAAIRSLGRKGHKITLSIPMESKDTRSIATFLLTNLKSKYVKRIEFTTPPSINIDRFIEDNLDLLRRYKYDVVLPFTHTAVISVSYQKDRVEEFAGVPFPDHNTIMKFHDKYHMTKIAEKLNVPVPKTIHPANLNEVESLTDKISYPAVIKARMGSGALRGVRYANNKDELIKRYKEITSNESIGFLDNFANPIIQEYIPGKIYDAAVIFNKGTLKGALTQIREVTYPINGGPGAINVTTDTPEIVEFGKRMLEHVQWHGPAQCEFKLDTRDNTFKLLEINTKFWGTLDLAIKAGIDFAEMAANIAHYGDTEPQFNYKLGLIYRWALDLDLLAALQSTNRIKSILGYVRRFGQRNTVCEIMFADWKPDLLILMRTLGMMVPKRILPKGTSQFIP